MGYLKGSTGSLFKSMSSGSRIKTLLEIADALKISICIFWVFTRWIFTLKQEYPKRDHSTSRFQLFHRPYFPPCYAPHKLTSHPLQLDLYFTLIHRCLWIAFSAAMATSTPDRTDSTVMARQSNSCDRHDLVHCQGPSLHPR